LQRSEQTAIWELVREVRQRLLTGLKPDGFNVGLNDGVGAGQSVQHAHVHALLRALADISVEKGDDSGASLTIPTHAISEKFVADSWRQSVPYAAGSSTRVLKPNTGDQAIV